MNKNTKVKCQVENCQHNHQNCCNLETLDISCTCEGTNCQTKTETLCKSFKKN